MNKFKDIINKFKTLKLIVIGDVMLDEHLWCKVDRISPEAPIPIAQIEKVSLMPGGAGNVANNISSLGANVELFGAIGKDSSAGKLLKTLRARKIGYNNLIKEKTRATILKSRIIAHNQHVVRVDRDDNIKLSKDSTNRIIKQFKKIIPDYDAVILSDYAKGFLTNELCKAVIVLSKRNKKIIAIDPKGNSYEKYSRATVITPNKHELEHVIKQPIANYKILVKSALKLKKKLKLDYIIVTRSEEGMTIIDKNNKDFNLSTSSHDVYDITGAGDTVIAVLTLGLASGLNIVDSARIANYAAGIVIGKVGTSVVEPIELMKALSSN